jgi:hypothetical protein
MIFSSQNTVTMAMTTFIFPFGGGGPQTDAFLKFSSLARASAPSKNSKIAANNSDTASAVAVRTRCTGACALVLPTHRA